MKPESMPPERWITRCWPIEYGLPDIPIGKREHAYHEAGHAVLMASIGRTETVAEIYDEPIENPEGGGLISGIVRQTSDAKPAGTPTKPDPSLPVTKFTEERKAALYVAAIYLAGHQAEYLLHGLQPDKFVRLLKDADSQNAREILHEHYGYHSGPLYYAQRMARSLLTERWFEVEHMASGILEHGSIDVQHWWNTREFLPPNKGLLATGT